ncbi:MAG: glycoside hydrolase family 1 protein [Candidatus Omnitrophica bacterium]|nr:glycoside hydrolase family 1 protein [Candidatus Omnitrophota bacterium]
MNKDEFVFPKKFLWGAATSSHQVEGDNIHNDWWEWEEKGRSLERSGEACDHWNRFREDFKLAKSLHHNAHRFSIEWSRIEPEEGKFDPSAILHYQEVVQALKSNGLEPVVTLFHFTLPLWLAKQGGWLSPRTPELFKRFSAKMAEALGDQVSWWITLNEPVVYVFKSYLAGDWPPGERSYEKAYLVFVHLLKAHVLAYDTIKGSVHTLNREETRVGIAQHISYFSPCYVDSWKHKISVWLRNLVFNHLFVKVLIQGRIFYPGIFRIRLHRSKTLDFIGLNYYTRTFIHNKGFRIPEIYGEVCPVGHHPDVVRRNSLKWEVYPLGLFQLVKDFSKYKLPLLIAENGICTGQDAERSQFIVDHLRQLGRAIKWGAPVIGYFYWSLLDNYEWADGFEPRFGLIEVDYKTQERAIRPSALLYGEICQSGALPS